MKRTTIYLPEQMKAALERTARDEGLSEADIIRHALAAELERRERPAPRLPLHPTGLGEPVADRVDELLGEGFGLD